MTPHHWIIEVLTDLQGFALQNDMPDLARHLEQTLDLATRELARLGNPVEDIAPKGIGCCGQSGG